MAVDIKASFKKDDRPNNGLERVSKDLCDRPHERRIVVAIVRPVSSKKDFIEGTETPKVQFDHIEVMDDDAGKDAWQLLAAAYEERTGNPLPPQSLFDNPSARDHLEGSEPIPGLDVPDGPDDK